MNPQHASIQDAIRQHTGSLRRFLQRTGLRAADVDDALQDVLVVFFQRYCDVAESAHRAFLLSTAMRVAADRRRLKWNRAPFAPLDTEISDECPSPEATLDERLARGLVEEALTVLPAKDKEPFLLAFCEGQSRREIAKTLGLPAGTVASRLNSASDAHERAVRRLLRQETLEARARHALAPWSSPGRLSRGVIAHPRIWTVHEQGTCRYLNNQWGRARAPGPFEQCLLTRGQGNAAELGWTWNWPGRTDRPFAFPEIIVGWKPWEGGRSTDERLPISIARTDRVGARYEMETDAVGSYVLLIDLWLIRAPRYDGGADPTLIGTEVMVQLDASGETAPLGQVIARPTIDGARYELWKGVDTAASASMLQWPAFVFRRIPGRRAGDLDLRALIAYLIARGHVSPEVWLASVELGDEIYGGSGTTWVRRFELDIAPR